MIPATREEKKKEAFRLFEDGRYQESLVYCHNLLSDGKDPSVEVLAATNLYYTGKLDDAEVFFRDLAVRMPDSSYVHSYLAKVLDAQGDEGAIAEYVIAVHLDPTNQDALRNYADSLLLRKDFRAAQRVLRRLSAASRRPGDIRNLMRACIGTGDAQEALAAHMQLGDGYEESPEYIDALMAAGDYPGAAESARDLYRRTRAPGALRQYLFALSRSDIPAARDAYESSLRDTPDVGILTDFVLFLRTSGDSAGAILAVRRLLEYSPDPLIRLLECDLIADNSGPVRACEAFEHLIRDELAAKGDPDLLCRILARYRNFLTAHFSAGEAERRFLSLVSPEVNAPCLIETGRHYEDTGNPAEARSWYYRAYRADFLNGGLEYARFLGTRGEERECEKVMLYILANAKKGSDLIRIARLAVVFGRTQHPLKRLIEQLIVRLEGRRQSLHSDGLELMARVYLLAASYALEEADYPRCKYYCLSGMDVMPVSAPTISLGDFSALIRECKEQSVADHPIMYARPAKRKAQAPAPLQSRVMADDIGLSDQEQKIILFLRSHRRATELELRKVLGTRRVVGMMNLLIQKAAEKGLHIIEKKGVGEGGEIYEYTGT